MVPLLAWLHGTHRSSRSSSNPPSCYPARQSALETFFAPADFQEYLSLVAQWCTRCKVQIWSYCLMPNHVHLIAVPESEDGLRRGTGEAHRRYTRYINFQKGWREHLWQGRFSSYPMDEKHLLAAARYIERNPVQVGMVKKPWDYRGSSANAHLAGEDDLLMKAAPLLSIMSDWQNFLSGEPSEKEYEALRRHERTGRPLGGESFLKRLEQQTSRVLRRMKPGPKTE